MNRIKHLRLAKGYSLDNLVIEMGGMVTKQALSKYERGDAVPRAPVANRLAAALGVKALELWAEPKAEIEFIAYRKRASLGKKKQVWIESLISQKLEERFSLQEHCYSNVPFELPVRALKAESEKDAEEAAESMRIKWRLGFDPIADLTAILEDHLVHVIQIESPDQFDGISAVAKNRSGETKAAAVVSRSNCPGDRQRLNLAHELGHLVLKLSEKMDPEKMAFRFAGAFLAPRACLKREIGEQRTTIRLEELLILKKRFGISVQALLRRLLDIETISQTQYTWWCIQINQLGWRKEEPVPLRPEKSEWLRQAVLRCLGEGFLTSERAETILGEKLPETDQPLPLRRKAFLNLPLEERRKILQQQAEQMASHYESSNEWKDIEQGDIVDYPDDPKAR